MEGHVTAPQLEKAIAEFERRIDDAEEDVEVVVATRVPIVNWRESSIGSFRSVFIEVQFLADERFVDLVITKVQGRARERAVASITTQLGIYAIQTGAMLAAGGGNMDMRFPITSFDDPIKLLDRDSPQLVTVPLRDCGTPAVPRLIVEVEFSNRSIPSTQTFCRQYFDPQLKAVLLFTFFGRRVNGTFACVAISLSTGKKPSGGCGSSEFWECST